MKFVLFVGDIHDIPGRFLFLIIKDYIASIGIFEYITTNRDISKGVYLDFVMSFHNQTKNIEKIKEIKNELK